MDLARVATAPAHFGQQSRTGARDRRALQAIDEEVTLLRTAISNVYFVGRRGSASGGWTLVDAGIPLSAGAIKRAAERLYGRGSRPAAIVLTHGHFDHVGGLPELAGLWQVPIYAHRLELPYLTGRSDYPPPDPSVGGGLMARLSPLYPRRALDLGARVHPLPEDGSVPTMAGWRWVHTPGHTPGHVSFLRERDRFVLAGDAFTTVKQESALAVALQLPEVHGPPAYLTTDWPQARASVEKLAMMEPTVAATGHGLPMRGARLRGELDALARNFAQLAVPKHGRYVDSPVEADESGVISVPPPQHSPATSRSVTLVGAAALAGVALLLRRRRSSRGER